MKKEKIRKALAVTLIPSVLLPSCVNNSYFLNDEYLENINDIIQSPSTRSFSSITIPINLNLNSEDQKFLDFLMKLIPDIINNPLIARQLVEDPGGIVKVYGIEDVNINFDDEIWKLIMSLGDEDLHDAIMTNDVSRFLALCEEKGLLSELKKSEILKYQDLIIKDAEVKPMCATLVFIGAAAVMLMGAAGCIGLVSAAAYAFETYWGPGSGDSIMSMSQRDPQAFQLWLLKQGKENTHVMLSAYQEEIINECIDALYQYFPEKMESVDVLQLRQFISLNMPK